ncbi:MAG TPA: hypothetical protein VF894_15540 [Anaeromyxobacter sp.]
MKISLRAAAALAAVALSTPAFAQQQQVSAGSRFGIGVGLPTEQGLLINAFDNIGFGPAAAPALYFPINVTPSFRLEPQIGRVSVSRDAGGGKGAVTDLGVGAFFVKALGPQVQVYVGPRLILSWFSRTDPGPTPDKFKARDTFFVAALGGEYLPHPRFAVGAEGQLGLVSIGDTEITDGVTGFKTEAAGGSATVLQGVLFVRVYLL